MGPEAGMIEAFEVTVAGGGPARAVAVEDESELEQAIAALAVRTAPVVLLYGGAGQLEDRHRSQIHAFFERAFLPAVTRLGATIIDGGTDAGVMRIVGEARERVRAPVRILGVAPFGKVRVPRSGGTTELARGHTDFILVPGSEWGAEAPWFHPIATRLSAGGVSAVLVNGGPLALEEIERSLDEGARVLIVGGTGRAADGVAGIDDAPAARTSPLAAIAASPLVTIVDVAIGPDDLLSILSRSTAEGEGR